MVITVDELVEERFMNRTLEEKFQILSQGKPKPNLSLSAIFTNDDGVPVTIYFDSSLYERVHWLTGSDLSQSLFCWPCLLFTSTGMWAKAGISNILHLHETISDHEKTADHVQAMLDLQMFIKQHSLTLQTSASTVDNNLHKDIVKRNRELLKRLTDVVSCFAMKQQAVRNRNKCSNVIKTEDCITMLQFLKNYDHHHVDHIDDAIELLKIDSNILNDLVDAVSGVMRHAIKEECQMSTYVSFIIGEHSDVTWESQVSMILRYLKGNAVCERFVGFTNLKASKSVDVIFTHIKNQVEDFDLQERWIAHAFDGGTLPTGELQNLLCKLQTLHSRAIFAPYHSHDLYYILQQSFSHIKECALFFKTMSSIEHYFQKNSIRWKSFEVFLNQCVPTTLDSSWFVRSRIINVVNNYRKYLLKFFWSVTTNRKEWDADDITKAFGFLRYLQELQTVFFLKLFGNLLEFATTLGDALKSQTPETIFNNVLYERLKNYLATEKECGFNTLWFSVSREMHENKTPQKRVKIEADDSSTISTYSELHSKIINHMIQDIELRFEHLYRLEFCNLLNPGVHVDFVLTINSIKKLMEFQGSPFDEEQVRNELAVLRTNSALFSDKSISPLYKFFRDTNLEYTFKNLYRLMELIITMPFKPTTAAQEASKIQEISDWSYIPENVTIPGEISLLCVEFDFLQELKKSDSFYNDVAGIFYEKNKTMELV